MSNHIDQLFKNKLSEHSLPPSEEAWAKVQIGLSKKNKVVFYWRAAAVFVLMALLISFWYQRTLSVEIPTQQLSKTENTESQDNPSIPSVSEKEYVNKFTTERESMGIDTRKNLASSKKSSAISIKESLIKESNETEEASSSLEKIEIMKDVIVAEVAFEKPIVIEFALPTIEENTPRDVSQAKSEMEKSTGIMKFLDAAKDVKNGDAEFGNSLRDIKNELLAFEFKKDKTRRN